MVYRKLRIYDNGGELLESLENFYFFFLFSRNLQRYYHQNVKFTERNLKKFYGHYG